MINLDWVLLSNYLNSRIIWEGVLVRGGKRSNKTDPVIIEGHRMIHNKQERLATCFVLLNVVWFWLFLRNGWLGERGCSFFSMEMLM